MGRWCNAGYRHVWLRQDNMMQLCCSLANSAPHTTKLENTEEFVSILQSDEYISKYKILDKKSLPENGCELCLKNEKLGAYSQRYKINDLTKNGRFFLKIDFSNKCNLKCVMCNSSRSTSWIKDEEKLLKVLPDKHKFFEVYPYEALKDDWWNRIDSAWWKKLGVIELSGGEPLYQEEAIEFLEYLSKTNPNIQIRIITNSTILDEKILTIIKRFDQIKLLCSVDAWKEDIYSYSRGGSLSLAETKKNILKLSEVAKQISIVDTVHCLTYDQAPLGMKWVEQSKKTNMKYFSNYVYKPRHLNPHTVLPRNLFPEGEKDIELQKRFYIWISELDKIRKTNILDIRPEFEPWLKELEETINDNIGK